MSDFINDSLFQDFITESTEHLQNMEAQLLRLEDGKAEVGDVINEAFRAIHSVKGSAGFLGLENIKELSHVMESLMMKIRDGEIELKKEMVTPLLNGGDKLSGMVADISNESEFEISAEVEAVEALLSGEVTEKPKKKAKKAQVKEPVAIGADKISGWTDKIKVSGESLYRFTVDLNNDYPESVSFDELSEHIGSFGNLFESNEIESNRFDLIFASVLEHDLVADALKIAPEKIELVVNEKEVNEPEPIQSVAKQTGSEAEQKSTKTAPVNETIRVNISLLDRLMNLVGELVLNRNQIIQTFKDTSDQNAQLFQSLDHLVRELQENMMNTRMQPVGQLFNKFPRLVRDLSKTLGKKIKLNSNGNDVELDKSILEALSDPLTHIIRNSVDHGLETIEERKAANKSESGDINLNAYHKGGHVIIEISDDGKGIDPEKIKSIAVKKGVISQKDADLLNESQAIDLIFRAGFSTADEVSDISGRGVGMDVVRTNISKLGGLIEIRSSVGKGTVTHIELPLTLAIIPSLLIRHRNKRFAIPQSNVEELVTVKRADFDTYIKKVKDVEVLQLRNRLLPLVYLDKTLNLAPPEQAPDGISVVIVSYGTNMFGIAVDELIDTEEIVVKPISNFIKKCQIYSGATILGDSTVAMILDISGIADSSKINFQDIEAENVRNSESQVTDNEERMPILIFNNDEEEYFACGLKSIVRLERIQSDSIKSVGNREYVDYLGKSLPLIRLENNLPIKPNSNANGYTDIMLMRGFEEQGGVVINSVIDNVQVKVNRITETKTTGMSGQIIVDDRLVNILQVESLFEALS